MRDLKGKKVLVFGKGESGQGAAYAIEKFGGKAVLCDGNDFFEKIGEKYEFAVISPGVDARHPVFRVLRQRNVEAISEIELGYLLCGGDIVAVTGTNGKTTTVKLIGDMAARQKNVDVCGNVGKSFSRACTVERDVYVVEVSSFQLERVKDFRPKISIITNISEDHLDRHGNMKNYAETKFNICRRQSAGDVLIVSADGVDVNCLDGVSPECDVLFFSTRERVHGAWIENEKIYFLGEEICNVDRVRLQGEHNLANVLCAVAAARMLGISRENVVSSLVEFVADKYRNEFERSVRGVQFYNDSKGTNVAATICAMRAMPSTFALIAGGKDKACGFEALFGKCAEKMVRLCLVGENAEKIMESARLHLYDNVEIYSNLYDATYAAYKSGADCVLFSPASASFDAYSSFIERGKEFSRIAREIDEIESNG